VFELENPEATVRTYEWKGILDFVRSVRALDDQTQWLDFGCGNGGLVRYVAAAGCRIEGFEEGWAAGLARKYGIPVLTASEMAAREGHYDVITAIEVIEHVEKPLEVLTQIRRLLKPGGLLFLTTGNAKANRKKLLEWGYAVPEIHISYFEAETMAGAMRKAGLQPEYRGFGPGFADIIRYKILKNLKQRETAGWERALPWELLSRLVNVTHQVTAHPVGWNKT
jgi:SAM-dependent methyltransferase